MKLIFTFFTAVLMAFFAGSFIGAELDINPIAASAGVFILTQVAVAFTPVGSLYAVTAADIVTEYGAFFVESGQNFSLLFQQLRQRVETTKLARRVVTENTQWQASTTTLGSIIQPFQKAFTESGILDFKPSTIQLRHLKVDMEIEPDDINESWLGFLTDRNLDRKTWPLVRYMIEQEVMPQIQDDLENQIYFYGEFLAPAVGVPGAVQTSLDGLRKLIDDGIDLGDMNEIFLSEELSPTNIFDMVEEFVDALPDALLTQPLILAMSVQQQLNYNRDRRNTHGPDTDYAGTKVTVDFRQNIEIVGLPSMAGSEYIWSTPRTNFIHVLRSTNIQVPRVENVDRLVKLFTDWWEGIGFATEALVWASRQNDSSS